MYAKGWKRKRTKNRRENCTEQGWNYSDGAACLAGRRDACFTDTRTISTAGSQPRVLGLRSRAPAGGPSTRLGPVDIVPSSQEFQNNSMKAKRYVNHNVSEKKKIATLLLFLILTKFACITSFICIPQTPVIEHNLCYVRHGQFRFEAFSNRSVAPCFFL